MCATSSVSIPLRRWWQAANTAGREIPKSLAKKMDKNNKFLSEMWKKLGITIEEEHGGMAMGYQAHCIVMEELSRASGKPSLQIRSKT